MRTLTILAKDLRVGDELVDANGAPAGTITAIEAEPAPVVVMLLRTTRGDRWAGKSSQQLIAAPEVDRQGGHPVDYPQAGKLSGYALQRRDHEADGR